MHLGALRVVPGPCQHWLGFLADLGERVFWAPPSKLDRLLASLAALLAGERATAPSLRAFAGKCVSLAPAVPGALLCARAMFDALAAAADRGGADSVPISGALRAELALWTTLRSWPGTRRWRSERHHVHVRVAAVASNTGWGGWSLLDGAPPVLCGDAWTEEEARLAVGTLAFLVTVRTLRCLPSAVNGSVVLLDGDDQAMVALLRGGRAARGRALLGAQRELFAVVTLQRGLFLGPS